jgi:hypothetical protein
MLLLAGDEIAIPHGKRLERGGGQEVGTEVPGLILNSEGHDLSTDHPIHDILLAVGKPGHLPSANYRHPMAIFQVQQQTGPVT